jgi:hypothetical protein
MPSAVTIILNIFSQAWALLVECVIAIFVLGVLYRTLQTVFTATMGAKYFVVESVSAIIALTALALFAFLVVPQLFKAAAAAMPETAGCGPISEVAQIAVQLIGAIGAIRMIIAIITGMTAAAVGGSRGISEAILTCIEVMIAMVLASIATPIAVAFLGNCYQAPNVPVSPWPTITPW